MRGRFGTVVTAMVTPFRDDFSLDLDRAQALASWLVDTGSHSLLVAGSTGESPTLTDQEKIDLWRAVAESVKGRAKVIAGTGTYDTAHSIHLTQEAEKAGADAILLVSPYYNKPPQRGLIEHFTKVSGATSLPVIVYNIPGRTGIRIEHDTLLRLAQVDNIVAVKDSTGDFEALAKFLRVAPDGFEVYCGDDWATFAFACLGAMGIISVASNLGGERLVQMLDLIEHGDIPGARKIHYEMLPLFHGLFITSNPIPVKAAMSLIGQPVGPPRLPLVPATVEEVAKIRSVLEESGLL
jgi:4-hydroxy-tetrahydrodipicolinate synthase